MKLINCIPSKGRPDLLSGKVLSWLCFSKTPYMVFVEPQDAEAYAKVVPLENLHVIDANDKGLGHVKSYIAQWLKNSEYDVAVKLDDDMRLCRRGALQSPELIAKHYDIAMRAGLEALAKYPEVAAIVFPYRWELWDVKQWSGVNARLQTCFMVRKDYWVGDPRVSTFEDFYNYLYIRSKNKMTLRYGLVGIDTDVGKGAGGLQSFDRHQLALKEVDVLREIYPALEFKKVTGKAWGLEPVLKGSFFNVKSL